MLSLTCNVLYYRHHLWNSRLHAGLKGAGTCWPGNSPATLFLFLLPPVGCCPYQLSHNNLCWDLRLYIVWTAGGIRLRFLFKNYFHLQQQLEAKSKLLPVCSWDVGLCVMLLLHADNDSGTDRCPLLENNPEGMGVHHVRGGMSKGIQLVLWIQRAPSMILLVCALCDWIWCRPNLLRCGLSVVRMQRQPNIRLCDRK